jgi:Fe-S oxidoreductase/nitrate reductase gamma subunit
MEASREILWNVGTLPNVVTMYLLFACSVVIAIVGLLRRAEPLFHARNVAPPLSGILTSILDILKNGVFQHGVNREKTPALFHTLIYVGFMVLLFTTTMVFIDHDLGIKIYRGNFYLAVTVLSDVFGLGLLIGILLAAYRRYVVRPDFLHSAPADAFFLLLLAALVIQGFLLEGLRIHVTSDQWALYSPVGYAVAQFFWSLSAPAGKLLHFVVWWIHTVNVFVLFALLPYTKMFHIVASSANLFFRSRKREPGQLEPVGDIEKLMESDDEFALGMGSLKDYSWKHLLDLDACTSCGRCQAECPAYLSGKPLSPKWVILDTRNHSYALQAQEKMGTSKVPALLQKVDNFLLKAFLLKQSGVSQNEEGTFVQSNVKRGNNTNVQNSLRSLGGNKEDRIAGDIIDPDVFWSCNTCYACVEVCPVGINHVDHIIGNRRNLALMHGEIPSEAQATLRALETRSNPFGAAEDRIKWADGLDLNILSPGDSVDYLYWVGCVSAFDQRKQKIAKSLVKIMKHAGLSYGVLGNAEGCSGDPARRLGEENLFQMLAKTNIETLKSVKFKTLVANCPHCFNTIKNEYPEFGNLGDGKEPEIIHHSVLLKRLLKEKKLALSSSEDEFTFHDPCYLGRYNGEYDAPRDALVSIGGVKLKEMERSREKGMCCGAGGGHFWMDLKIGERVNVLRFEQAAETGVDKVASACPFCMQMLEDGAKLTGREETHTVRDIAEVVADNLVEKE